jgi:hypothetical protein
MYRRKETHSSHAWVLGKLCGNFNVVQEYVVMACFKKMLSRMNNKFLSLPYFHAITNLPIVQFKETDLKPEPKEIDMDKNFRAALLLMSENKLLKTPVTKLREIISEKSAELYTKDTCQEFHEILCELLKLFLKFLEKLDSLDNPIRSEFDVIVRKVACYGEALQMIAGGVAIRRHFQVIEDELSISHHKRARDVANQTRTLETKRENDDVEGRKDVEQEKDVEGRKDVKREKDVEQDKDEDLQSVQPFAIRDGKPLKMSRAARDWLKLMVVHFDALKIVVAYHDRAQISKLTIKVIVPPPLNEEMLSWKDLLRDANSNYKSDQDFNPLNIPTSGRIINFLEDHADKLETSKGSSSIYDMIKKVNQLVQLGSSEPVSPDDLKIMEVHLSGLREGMSPDQTELTQRISSHIKQLKNTDKRSRDLLYSIGDLLESLDESSIFFKKLRPGSALSTGKGFSGAVHCEIFLASLIIMAKTSPLTLPEDVQRELLVSHHFHILFISI